MFAEKGVLIELVQQNNGLHVRHLFGTLEAFVFGLEQHAQASPNSSKKTFSVSNKLSFLWLSEIGRGFILKHN